LLQRSRAGANGWRGAGVARCWRPDQGKKVMATPNLKDGLITIINMSDWTTI
jgi:hypothetical protein